MKYILFGLCISISDCLLTPIYVEILAKTHSEPNVFSLAKSDFNRYLFKNYFYLQS